MYDKGQSEKYEVIENYDSHVRSRNYTLTLVRVNNNNNQ